MEKLLFLNDVIMSINEYKWNYWLYVSNIKQWNENTKCAVLNVNDLALKEEHPIFAIDNKLIEFLNISDVKSIIKKYSHTHENTTIEELYNDLIYYYENDAFID